MNIIGSWTTDRSDLKALAEFGDVALEFHPGGDLTYVISEHDKVQVIHMTYRVEGSTLVTDQPSSPREERTDFTLSDDGAFTLGSGASAHRFTRPTG